MKKLVNQLIPFLLVLMSCVDPANVDTPPFQYQVVVDGYITTEPGPYTVKIFRTQPLVTNDLDRIVGEISAKVYLKDDVGNEELLTEVDRGIYKTAANGIQGVAGRSYHIEFQLNNGKRFESIPELLKPVGEVTDIKYEFVEGDGSGVDKGDGFRIFVDATGVPDVEDLVRLRMVATYKVQTFPELRVARDPAGAIVPSPFPCSGYENRNNQLVKVGECTCCYCWVDVYDEVPAITNEEFTMDDVFLDREVGIVAANRNTLYEKIHVEVQELSLTPATYQFWKLVKAQKEGASNIFQPPSGKLRGNIKAIDSSDEVLGIFWAAGIHKKSIFIDRKDVPYPVLAIDTLKAPCTFFPNSTTQKPAFWQ
jgi:hypothetical protein